MNKKSKNFYIILEDDWELKGNGLGNVAELQYLPSLFLMNLCKKLNIKMTFMVDVAQQLKFIEYSNYPEIEIQKELWDNTVKLMKYNGFDVQLHLHPQWVNAKYDGHYFYVDNDWNIGNYDEIIQKNLIQKSIKYLNDLFKFIDPQHKIISFKPGSWGMQPSEILFNLLSKNDIELVVGIKKGLYIPNLNVDYRNLEESVYPYYPDFKDITKLSPQKNNIILLPLLEYSPDIITLSKLFSHILKRKIFNKIFNNQIKQEKIPNEIRKLNPIARNKFNNNLLNPYSTHLKIGNQPFEYFKKSFDKIINELEKLEVENIPIIIESHTKDYIDNYKNIEKFLEYIIKHPKENIKFITFTEFIKMAKDNKFIVKYKYES